MRPTSTKKSMMCWGISLRWHPNVTRTCSSLNNQTNRCRNLPSGCRCRPPVSRIGTTLRPVAHERPHSGAAVLPKAGANPYHKGWGGRAREVNELV
ncbi:hypothetical protein PIB30_015418 [Stylosanthes scabra]|uniref:Uncharacterized protein n=1 Tax=Stylosanthes scabra TaxID=79078 RepID=A0ABU6T6Q4_9FABA|nr:hypothetical protein [Stylosanthes scabra]